MIPLKARQQKAIQAAKEIVQPEYTLIEILDALEELWDEISVMIEAVRDDVEREVE